MIAKLEREKEIPTGNILISEDLDETWAYYRTPMTVTVEQATQLRDELTYLIERLGKETA